MNLNDTSWFLVGRVYETHNPEVTGSSPVPAKVIASIPRDGRLCVQSRDGFEGFGPPTNGRPKGQGAPPGLNSKLFAGLYQIISYSSGCSRTRISRSAASKRACQP